MKLVVVTGFVKIPGHPRGPEEYDRQGARLGELHEAPVRPFRCELCDCWLDEYVCDKEVVHAIGDNPKKNTLAYHVVQHQKTSWILQAAKTDPSADILIWLDYGILHQPGVTIQIIDDFLRRVRAQPQLAIPGAWKRSDEGVDDSPDWRFLGSSLVVPRDYALPLHASVRDVTLERLEASHYVTWEVNDWAEVDRRGMLPIRWYQADHNHTQFTNYD